MVGGKDEDNRAKAAISPVRLLLVAALACIIVCAIAGAARLRQREIGLVLEADRQANVVRIKAARGPSANVPSPSILLAIRAGERVIWLRPSDVIEEPDFFDTYPEMAEFFHRQSELAAILESNDVALLVSREEPPPGGKLDTGEQLHVVPVSASFGSLPPVFWFQLAAGVLAFLVSIWALVLRPRELAVRLFAFIGATIPMFVLPAAIYGTRELAIDGDVFRAMSSLNHTGANLFGCGLVAFFLSYPRRLVGWRGLAILLAVIVSWLILDIARLAPDQNSGSRAPIFLEMIGAIVLGVVQWRATRGDPRGRAGLRWLGVSVLMGSGLFVFSVVGSTVLGLFPPVSQGYSFGFFLLMHASFAFGLGRHRLFDLDEWAYKLLFWSLAGVAVVGLDVVLVSVLALNRTLSAGAALVVCGFLYLPLRSWLWSRIVSRRSAPEHEVFDAVLQVTFAVDKEERAGRWKELLRKLFDPIELGSKDETVDRATILEDGLRLEIPNVGTIPAQALGYPWRGRGLFGPRHAALADNLVTLARQAEGRREAFERGVRDERSRIARDMHDDIGAGLLSSLHRDDLDSTRDAIRQAIGDVRSIVHELTWRELTLGDALAEMRLETVQRLEAVEVNVEWPIMKAPPSTRELRIRQGLYRHLTSILRELTSNVIRHAKADLVKVRVDLGEERLRMTFRDNGRGFDASTLARRSGLSNLERRAASLGGSIVFSRADDETVVAIDLPLEAPATSEDRVETPPP